MNKNILPQNISTFKPLAIAIAPLLERLFQLRFRDLKAELSPIAGPIITPATESSKFLDKLSSRKFVFVPIMAEIYSAAFASNLLPLRLRWVNVLLKLRQSASCSQNPSSSLLSERSYIKKTFYFDSCNQKCIQHTISVKKQFSFNILHTCMPPIFPSQLSAKLSEVSEELCYLLEI